MPRPFRRRNRYVSFCAKCDFCRTHRIRDERAVSLGSFPRAEGRRESATRTYGLCVAVRCSNTRRGPPAASGVIDRTVLSTDSERIAAEGRRLGIEVPFIRPAELARDDTPMLPVIEHAVDFLEQRRLAAGNRRAPAADVAASERPTTYEMLFKNFASRPPIRWSRSYSCRDICLPTM